MSTMKKLMGAALFVGASIAGATSAQAEVSGNIALTTDYVFRGVSLSGGDPVVQGGFDWSNDSWYAGVWGSSLGSAGDSMELDLYGGWTPTTGPVTWDLGLIGYFYPGAEDDGAEFDYVELKVGGTYAFNDKFSLGGAVYYSPENYGDTGNATYIEINGDYGFSDALHVTGAFGNQSVEDPDGPLPGTGRDDYNTWNIGATYALHGFELDLRYHDTDIEAGSDIESYTYGPASYDAAVVATIKREL